MKIQKVLLVAIHLYCSSAYAGNLSIGSIFGSLIGNAAGQVAGGKLSQQLLIDEAIVKLANQVNQQLPMVVDQDTRWDNVSPGVGHQFTYNYTFIKLSSQKIDRAAWYRNAKPLLHNRVCTSKDMQIFFQNGVSISYSFEGKDGVHVGKVTITPSDCGYKS